MANEIRVTATLSAEKSSGKIPTLGDAQRIDMTGVDMITSTQSVGTSDEVLVQPTEIGTLGWVWLKNLDDTNFVSFGLTSSYTIKLLAGEECVFRAAGADIYALADTASCVVQYAMIEE